MIGKDIVESLERDPFEPFRIVTSSGVAYKVSDPHSVAIMKSRLCIATPDDRWVLVPYLHITALEKLRNGGTRRRKGKK